MHVSQIKYIVFIFIIFIVIAPLFVIAQKDTTTTHWSPETIEIFNFSDDSMHIEKYYQSRYAKFKEYFILLTQEEQNKIEIVADDFIKHIHQDSLKNPDYLSRIFFYFRVRKLVGAYRGELWKEKYQLSYQGQFDTIALVFFYQGKRMILNDNFKVFFIVSIDDKNHKMQAQTCGNSFVVPNLGTDTIGMIMFEYRKKYYNIFFMPDRNLYKIKLLDMLTLHFYKKPYPIDSDQNHDNNLNIIDNDVFILIEKEHPNIEGFFYIIRNRWCTVMMNPIYNINEFYKENKKIVRKAKKRIIH